VVKLNGGAELVATDGLGKPDAKLLRRREQVKFAWQRDSAQIDPVLHTHFEDQGKAIGSWVEYEAILSDYAELACCTSAKTRTELVQDVRAFFTRIKSRDQLPHPTSSDPWTVLRCAGQSCTQTRQWRVNYHWLGRRLLRSRGELARYLLDAHASNLG
jgi:hypothetical protein